MRQASAQSITNGRVRHVGGVGRTIGHDEAADLLQQTLDEEKAADEKLSGLAEGGINQSAADASQSEDESDDGEDTDEEDSDDEEKQDARPVGRRQKERPCEAQACDSSSVIVSGGAMTPIQLPAKSGNPPQPVVAQPFPSRERLCC